MINKKIILYQTFGVLFILFITSVAWGQQESQSESSTESETIKIIREIHQLEKNLIKEMYGLDKQMRDHVDKNMKDINKQISDMNSELGSLKATTTMIKWIMGIIAIPIALYILSLTFPELLFWQKEKKEAPKGLVDTTGEPLANNSNTINQPSP